jgi:hypothetical protein
MVTALMGVGLRLLKESSELLAKRAPISSLLTGTLLVLAACGGSQRTVTPLTVAQNTTSDGGGETITPNAGPETGPPTKIVTVVGGAGAVVGLFPDGRAFYSPDGFNLAGGGSTVAAYNGDLKVVDIVGLSTGVDALLSDGSVTFSPDGMNLGGGGATVRAYTGTLKIETLTQVGAGVDVVFSPGGGAVYSPDGRNFDVGGTSVPVYVGNGDILQIIAVGPGDAVVTLFDTGTTFYSPNNRDIGGGGSTVSATPGARSPIKGLARVGGGVLAEFNNGAVYLSPDGKNLAGGGASVVVPAWNTKLANGPFAPRDSAHGSEFLGKLWLSGGFADATNANSCFLTCSFFDLWSSTDSQGASWNSKPSFATATAPNPRDAAPVENNGVQDVPVPTDFYDSYSPLVVWNGQLTAIGATVWRSADGVTWARQNLADGVTAAPGPATLRADENSRAVVLGASLFFLQPDSGEVYRSGDPNAAIWTDLGAIPGFTPRCASAVFVLQGKIWIVSGGACDYSKVFNDMWSSEDGVTWTQSAKLAEWSARMWPCVVTGGDGVAWLAAGYAPTDWNNSVAGVVPRYGANHSDVWYSKDGSDWKQFKADDGSGLTDDGGLEPRHAATCYVTTGSSATSTNLVIMAGTGGVDPNDANAHVINSIRALSLPATTSLP